jgi:hypothetical protein
MASIGGTGIGPRSRAPTPLCRNSLATELEVAEIDAPPLCPHPNPRFAGIGDAPTSPGPSGAARLPSGVCALEWRTGRAVGNGQYPSHDHDAEVREWSESELKPSRRGGPLIRERCSGCEMAHGVPVCQCHGASVPVTGSAPVCQSRCVYLGPISRQEPRVRQAALGSARPGHALRRHRGGRGGAGRKCFAPGPSLRVPGRTPTRSPCGAACEGQTRAPCCPWVPQSAQTQATVEVCSSRSLLQDHSLFHHAGQLRGMQLQIVA